VSTRERTTSDLRAVIGGHRRLGLAVAIACLALGGLTAVLTASLERGSTSWTEATDVSSPRVGDPAEPVANTRPVVAAAPPSATRAVQPARGPSLRATDTGPAPRVRDVVDMAITPEEAARLDLGELDLAQRAANDPEALPRRARRRAPEGTPVLRAVAVRSTPSRPPSRGLRGMESFERDLRQR
jgi:hypothetical protein